MVIRGTSLASGSRFKDEVDLPVTARSLSKEAFRSWAR
jgi:hypothetical protein